MHSDYRLFADRFEVPLDAKLDSLTEQLDHHNKVSKLDYDGSAGYLESDSGERCSMQRGMRRFEESHEET